MFKSYFLLIFLLFVFIVSCKKSSDSTDPAPSFTQWYSHKQNTNDTITAKNGYLYLSTRYAAVSLTGSNVVSVTSIKGDFEILVKYSSFQTSGTNTFSDEIGFSLVASEFSNAILSGNLSNSTMYMSDSSTSSLPIFKSTLNRDGEFYVKRTGSTYTSWMRAGSDTLRLNRVNYITQDLSIVFNIASTDNTATHTSVHIDDFTITGGGDVLQSDPFDTNNNITAN